ncbi:MAG: NADPH-dependent F420 reductase [bacterium]|nr:NADPH-dependent F420 reductase [bacterium]
MKIGFIGAGNIGGTAAKLFVDAGHEVVISNSRGPETLADVENETRAKAVAVEEAAVFGDVIFVSIPLGKYKSLSPSDLDGKIVIDSNNYYPGRDGEIAEVDSGLATSSELLAKHLSGSKVVKAFNTIWFEHLRSEGDKSKPIGERRVIFVSGDDADAKSVVSGLIEEIGFAPYDLGTLGASGIQQPDSVIYNKSINIEEARKILAENSDGASA